MKIAEALQERADLQKRIEQLAERMNQNALVQENDAPLEDPAALLAQLEGCLDRLETLIAVINRTNCETVVDGATLTQWIARRDVLDRRISVLRNFTYACGQKTMRATRGEIRIESTMDVAALQKQLDTLSAERRCVDNRIQSANWTTEIAGLEA